MNSKHRLICRIGEPNHIAENASKVSKDQVEDHDCKANVEDLV